MSIEQGCRRRLELTEDGRAALRVLDVWELRLASLQIVIDAVRAGATLELQGPRSEHASEQQCRAWLEENKGADSVSVHVESADPEHALVELGLRWKEQT